MGARSDSELIAACRNGQRESFDILVERHQTRIYNLCYWMLGNADDAADAAQDVFVRAYRGLHWFRGNSEFGTWLHRIAVNVARDCAARRRRLPQPVTGWQDGEAEPLLVEPPDPAPGPEARALTRERRLAVRAALGTLNESHRVALVLFDIEGRSYEDAAQLLDLPLGTFKSRLSRARLALRDALHEQRELFHD